MDAERVPAQADKLQRNAPIPARPDEHRPARSAPAQSAERAHWLGTRRVGAL